MSGDFEMISIKTGDRLTIQMDGSELRDQVIPHRLNGAIEASIIVP
jgi:hypothetical protein